MDTLSIIATDEAGYGPNLGPLVISGTVWQLPLPGPATSRPVALEALSHRLSHARAPGADGDAPRVLLGDSKQLYSPGGGLRGLERGVLAAVRLIKGALPDSDWPTHWRALLAALDPAFAQASATVPWYRSFDCRLPSELPVAEVAQATQQLRDTMDAAGARLVGAASRIVCAEQYNRRVADCGNKATALSLWTLDLIAQLFVHAPSGPVAIACDKHGGRNRYGALLQQAFPDNWIEVVSETAASSVYRWGPADRRVEAQFTVRGEQFAPIALSSMISKYLRELAMRAFNDYWTARVPGLKPTAGYPADARRFHQQIAAVQRREAIPDASLWRMR